MIDGRCLNIGAGTTHIPGFVNIDQSPRADIALDLSSEPLPFHDNSVDLVFSYHTLEHVPNYLFALGEIYRVVRHGGLVLLGLPYVTLTEFNLVNPYHFHHFSEHSFDFFTPGKLRGSAAEETDLHMQVIGHRFHYLGFWNLVPAPIRRWARRHLFNVVRCFDIALVVVKDSTALDVPPASQIWDLFNQCLEDRTEYEQRDRPALRHSQARLLLQRRAPWAYDLARDIHRSRRLR